MADTRGSLLLPQGDAQPIAPTSSMNEQRSFDQQNRPQPLRLAAGLCRRPPYAMAAPGSDTARLQKTSAQIEGERRFG